MKEYLLISRAVHGSRRALEELVRMYYEKIYTYVYYRVMDYALAEDLTQDVFVKLTKSIHSYRPGAPFSAYLYRIAHNTVVDYYRKVKQEEELSEQLPAPDMLSLTEEKLDAQQLLAQLPQEQRECIVLYYLQGLSYREISQILSVPIPTVKSRVQRGLASCRKRMEEKL